MTKPPTPEPEFFVGYLPKAPPGIARLAAAAVAALLGLALGVAAITTLAQAPPVPSAWPDDPASRRGVIVAKPYPVLYHRDAHGELRGVLLVAVGKHGLLEPADFCGPGDVVPPDPERQRLIRALLDADGRIATVRGTILAREGAEMLEVTAIETEPAPPADATVPPTVEDLGPATVPGEIVDPKCYFGAMKPGAGQTHRACAIRCVLGGITPVLVAHNRAGQPAVYVLTDAQGRPANQLVRDHIADPVTVSGRLSRRGDILFLALDQAPSDPAKTD